MGILDDLKRIALTTDIRDLKEAVLADIIDAIPIVGDISNLAKLIDAKKKNEKLFFLVLRFFDFVGGLIPGVGEWLDIFTPTNTLVYLLKKR